jgi:hypothetical protein
VVIRGAATVYSQYLLIVYLYRVVVRGLALVSFID